LSSSGTVNNIFDLKPVMFIAFAITEQGNDRRRVPLQEWAIRAHAMLGGKT
jgi:hypothetical protein